MSRVIEVGKTCTWVDFEQGSEGWLKSRCGLLTASKGMDMSSMLASGKESAKRMNLKMDILAERFTGIPAPCFNTAAMRWGTDTEPFARQTYVEVTGNQVQICGLALSTEVEFLGASPDGLVGDEGLIEIKCPNSDTFMRWVIAGEVPEQHKPQMLTQLAVTGRKWCDFVAFDPRYPPEQDLFVRRFAPHPAQIDDMKKSAAQFLAEVAELEKMFIKARML